MSGHSHAFGDGTGQHLDDNSHAGKPVHSKRRNPPADGRKPKTRTKTGCLTCRKRRIKCGEEKPHCTNCIKSKRDCEQGRTPSRSQPDPRRRGTAILFAPAVSEQSLELAPIRNQPDPYARGRWTSSYTDSNPTPNPELEEDETVNPFRVSRQAGNRSARPVHAEQGWISNDSHAALPLFESSYGRIDSGPLDPQSLNASSAHPTLWGARPLLESSTSLPLSSYAPAEPYVLPSQSLPVASLHEYLGQREESIYDSRPGPQNADYDLRGAANPLGVSSASNQQPPTPWPQSNMQRMDSANSEMIATKQESSSVEWEDHQVSESLHHNAMAASRELDSASIYETLDLGLTQFLEEAAIEVQDDDYYDVESEELSAVTSPSSLFEDHSLENDLKAIVSMTQHNLMLAASQPTTSFTMADYRPERTASPLRNPFTQRVFSHFVFSTGPLISFLEDRQRPAFHGRNLGPRRASRAGLWTHMLAMGALHDQGLLQSMLAMSSFHIAKLENGSVTPSLKHYSYAIRNIHRSVNSTDQRRHHVTTLAATLLLAFYEVVKADHRAWSTHLVGALQLVKEIDYGGMTDHIKFLKGDCTPATAESGGVAYLAELFPDVDIALVNKMRGIPTSYDSTGRIIDEPKIDCKKSPLSDADLREYQVFQDLFWYSLRHDMILSLVGGGASLLDYSLYGLCPPRAPVGDVNAPQGTFDHLVLVAGRLIKFMVADRDRKIRCVAAADASQASSTRTNDHTKPGTEAMHGSENTGARPPPSFYGMAPRHANIGVMPRAFLPGYDNAAPPRTSEEQEVDLDNATALALGEWNDVMEALKQLGHAMSKGFGLVEDSHPPMQTPFGPAIIYASYGIATLWAYYYAILIVAWRVHPSMPAPMIFAVVAAMKHTSPYAALIGRILYPCSSTLLNTVDHNRAGAFAEACLPLFLAGVQYTADNQRRWLLARFSEIESITGWATISLMAGGCEHSWVGMYKADRGPPWQKLAGVVLSDEDDDQSRSGSEHATAAAASYSAGRSREVSTDGSDASGHAVREHVLKEGRIAPFRQNGGSVMWAYQLYTHGTLRD